MRPKGTFILVMLLAGGLGACGTTQKVTESVKNLFSDNTPEKLETRRLSIFEYEDKLLGAWAGKMIGVSVAAPYEFRFQGEVMEEPMRLWQPEFVENALQQDDLYVQMTFLRALEDKGLSISPAEAADYFSRTEYPLAHANDVARNNIRAGILPPDSGHPRYNPHANDIDFQIDADLFGIVCPGMPFTAIRLAEVFGPMMSYGDGLYGGLFVAGMYSAAYFENDRAAVIEQGLKGIPAESQYAQLIRDVLEFYRKDSADWRGCWQMLEDKWAKTDLCPDGYNKPFNIDAKLNGGYVALALLYGEADFPKTLEIATRCGQDNDCNTSTAAGILGAMQGYSRIPRPFKVGIPVISEKPFLNTKYTFTTLIQTCKKLTEIIIRRNGGDVQRLGDREYFSVPVQSPPPPPSLEQFTENMMEDYKPGWIQLEKTRREKFQAALQQDFAKWSKGWTLSHCGTDMPPGLRETYAGRFDVFVTHPQDQNTPCALSWKGTLPPGNPQLRVTAAASDRDPGADWLLRMYVNDQKLDEKTVGLKDGAAEWHEYRFDLTPYAGQEVTIRLENAANGWNFEAAYWGKIEIAPGTNG